MNRVQAMKTLFRNKEAIIEGYKKTFPNVNVGGANVQSVTNTLRLHIVDPDDNVISVLTYDEAMSYAKKQD